MPAVVNTEPLSVHFQFPNATTWTARLAGLPNPRLAADLAQGLPHLTHPLGGIATRCRASHYVTTLRRMVHELTDAGFTGGAEDLTRPLLIRYWMAAAAQREALTRGLLAGFDSARVACRGRPCSPDGPGAQGPPGIQAARSLHRTRVVDTDRPPPRHHRHRLGGTAGHAPGRRARR